MAVLRINSGPRIAFLSKPIRSGNAWALYRYLVRSGGPSARLFWYDGPVSARAATTADAVVFTHGAPFRKAPGQAFVNLWHGMPLKGLVYTDRTAPPEDLAGFGKLGGDMDMLIATSPLTRCLLAACFNVDARRVKVTGQPRNDWLFEPGARGRLARLVGPKAERHQRIVFYMPTFRSRPVESRPVEGKAAAENAFRLSEFDLGRFDGVLRELDALLVCKFHINDEAAMVDALGRTQSENITLLSSRDLAATGIDLYEVLAAADALITDYSSVFFDFLLLDRPCLFFPVDLEEYRAVRSFLLEPYDFWTPGPKVFDQVTLQDELESCLVDPARYSQERRVVNSIINSFVDGSSCERVWREVRHMLAASMGATLRCAPEGQERARTCSP